MFLFWRMIVLAVALAAVLYGIGRSRIRRRRIAAVLGAALCLLAMTVSAMFPAENLVMSFRSPEDVFSYMESGEVLDVLEGDASCAVIYADGRYMAGNLIAAKAADGYHLPGYFSAQRIFHRSDREGTFDIYRMAGTEDYYLFGTVVTKSPELRIADASEVLCAASRRKWGTERRRRSICMPLPQTARSLHGCRSVMNRLRF